MSENVIEALRERLGRLGTAGVSDDEETLIRVGDLRAILAAVETGTTAAVIGALKGVAISMRSADRNGITHLNEVQMPWEAIARLMDATAESLRREGTAGEGARS